MNDWFVEHEALILEGLLDRFLYEDGYFEDCYHTIVAAPGETIMGQEIAGMLYYPVRYIRWGRA